MADSISWLQISSLFIFGLFVLTLVEGKKDHEARISEKDGGGNGGGLGPCDVNPTSFLPPPYSNISNLSCKPIWNTFVLRYSESEDKVMTIIVSAVYTSGWIGMGFSKDGMMIGSSAIVGWINKQGIARVKQYYLQGTHPSQVIPDKGGLQLSNFPAAVVLHDASIFMAFQLKFDTPISRQSLLFAIGTAYPYHFRLTKHNDKTAIMFDFSHGSAGSTVSSTGPENHVSQMKKTHGTLGIIGWGLILPIGAIVARYFKHKDPLWYYLHTITQFVGFIIGLAAIVVGRQLYDTLNSNIPVHRGIGIFALVLSILQILGFFLRPNKEAKIRKYWNWYHHWFGRLALFFGALNIVLGIKYGGAGKEWQIGYGFLVGIVIVAVIVLEALSWKRNTSKPSQSLDFHMNPVQ